MNTFKTRHSKLAAAFVLLLSFFAASNANAKIVSINKSSLWSAHGITSGDDVEISGNGTYVTIDVAVAQCRSLTIGKNAPHIMGLIFTGSNTLTVAPVSGAGGFITGDFGGSNGTRGAVIDFGTNSATGTLTCQGFVGTIASDTFYLTPGSGTIRVTGTNSLPATMKNFHNIILDGATTLNTDINVTGNFAHNAAFVPNGKRVTFNGTSNQAISGSATPSFYSLTVNKSAGDLNLNRPANINNNLTLTAGKINLGAHALTMVAGSSVSGGSSNSYVRANGTGKLFMTVYKNSSTLFPVGINPYIPVTIQLPNAVSTPSSVEFAVGAVADVYQSGANSNQVTDHAVGNTWSINPSSLVNDVVVTLAWPSSQNLLPYNAASSFILWRNSNGIWSSTSGTTPSNISATAPNYSQSTPSFNFPVANMTYEFAVGDIASQFNTSVPLPVEFISFTATKQGNEMAMLNFSTAWEVNNAGFEVERSTNGISWNKIGFVQGKGNSSEISNYSFATALTNINSAVVYYRLKQVDFNGQFEYSATRTLRLNATAAKATSVYPNPATSRISVSLEGVSAGEMAKISVMDMSGKILISANQVVEEGNFTLDMNIDNLTKGNYIVNISSASANYNTKLVKF